MIEVKYYQGFEKYPDNLKNEEIAKNIPIYGEYDTVKKYSEKAFYDGQKALIKRILEDIENNPDFNTSYYFGAYKNFFKQ